MARAYRMTSARRAAIKKAQRISAQKRRGKRRKIAVGAGLAATGVIGVTLYATKGRKGKKSAPAGKVNVVSATLQQPERKLSSSKEIDLIRIDLADAVVRTKSGRLRRIDFGRVGQKSPHYDQRVSPQTLRRQTAAKKAAKAAEGKRVRGISRSGSRGADRVLRNRVSFNDSRRAEYSPSARKALYKRNAKKIKVKNDAKAARKRQRTALQATLSQKVLGNISINSLGAPKSGWPLY